MFDDSLFQTPLAGGGPGCLEEVSQSLQLKCNRARCSRSQSWQRWSIKNAQTYVNIMESSKLVRKGRLKFILNFFINLWLWLCWTDCQTAMKQAQISVFDNTHFIVIHHESLLVIMNNGVGEGGTYSLKKNINSYSNLGDGAWAYWVPPWIHQWWHIF